MRFGATSLPGAWTIDLDRVGDERGHFARTYCAGEFAAHGLDPTVAQCNTSYNARAGTLRGLHYQADPHGETKLIRCTRGAIFDVLVDLRPASPTYRRWEGLELTQDDARELFVPVGLAHGFQTLVDDTEVHYQMGHEFVASHARGVRWDDPAFAIEWPSPPGDGRVISEKDRAYPDFSP